MLRGIPDIIGSDLLKALADTGHGDLIVIADHFYPHVTKCPNGVSIQAKGVGSVEMLDAILQLVPLDVEYEKQPIQYIVPDADSGIVVETNPVWDAVKEGDEPAIEVAERFGHYLGWGLALVAGVINPDVYVIGGGMSSAGEVILPYIEKNYRAMALPAASNARVCLAALGNDAGILGAARLMLQDEA